MPQLEEGTTASDFVENTTGSPKFIASATYGPRVPMILVEPSATNLVAYSEDFSDEQWLKNNYGTGVVPTVNSDVAISPDGTQNADKVIFDVGSGTTTGDSVTLEDYISVTQGETYTFSVYLKGEQGGEQVLVRHAGSAGYTTLTLTDEWVKYEVTETAIYNYAYVSLSLRQGLGGVIINPTATFYIWGAQLETGSVATSYIPTTSGSTVTRAKDDLEITGSDFTDFFNASEGTTYVEFTPDSDINIPHIFEYYDASNSNSRMGAYLTTGKISYYVVAAADADEEMGNINIGSLNRFAVSYKLNDMLGSLNGASEVPETTVTMPTGIDNLQIGNDSTQTYSTTGRYRRIIYWPYHSDSL